ncbi:MAG: hypothetical protein HFI38_09700 [Lachnospiraceae bacterium]|nr:hypothetical protein [Lachnospiraceae bacterium]
MKGWRRTGKGYRLTALFLAALVLMGFILGRTAKEDGVVRQAGREILAVVEKKLFFGAVCAVSPWLSYVIDAGEGQRAGEKQEKEPEQKGEAEGSAEDVRTTSGNTVIYQDGTPEPSVADVIADEKELQAEWERLLLGEQARDESGTKQPGTGQQEQMESGDEPGETDGQIREEWNPFPEDMDEYEVNEPDADLLAEIDRENEMLRELAREQALANQLAAEQAAAGEQPAEASGQVLPLAYSMEQLNDLNFLIQNCYAVNRATEVDGELLNAASMLEQDMKLQSPDSGGPKVLIHHTHATEYFADSDPDDSSTLIVGVGDYLEEILETQYGIEVIHDRTVYPYNEAYSRALQNVEQILAENPSIEVFIDLHRDAGGSEKYTVNIDGKETANIMFFNGISRNTNGPIDYLNNDNLSANLAFSFQLKMAGDSMYPGLCKRNHLKAYRYNLHVLERAVIIEVGDNNNTLEEARNAMEPLARILNYVLNGR